MDKTKNLEEKVKHSLIVKNLCESMGVFLKSMADLQNMADEYGDEIDDEFGDEENEEDENIIPF